MEEKRLLVVVDMQNDFISGTLGSDAAKNAIPAVAELISREKQAGAEIVFTQDTHGKNYLFTREGKYLPVPHCLRGSEGWEIVPELAPYADGARTFEKYEFGSIALADYARKGRYREIILCGVCTDICVVSNAILLKTFCTEAEVKVISAACAGTSAENHAAALRTLQSCHILVG